MTHHIIYNGTTCFITGDQLREEFNQRYSERLNLMDLHVYQPESEETESTIICEVSPATPGISTFGLNIRRIDFNNKYLEIIFRPSQFAVIRDEYTTQLLQVRKSVS